MLIRILHEEVCEICKQLKKRVIVFGGFHHTEEIAVCKECTIKGYDMLRKDEAKKAAEDMRKIH